MRFIQMSKWVRLYIFTPLRIACSQLADSQSIVDHSKRMKMALMNLGPFSLLRLSGLLNADVTAIRGPEWQRCSFNRAIVHVPKAIVLGAQEGRHNVLIGPCNCNHFLRYRTCRACGFRLGHGDRASAHERYKCEYGCTSLDHLLAPFT